MTSKSPAAWQPTLEDSLKAGYQLLETSSAQGVPWENIALHFAALQSSDNAVLLSGIAENKAWATGQFYPVPVETTCLTDLCFIRWSWSFAHGKMYPDGMLWWFISHCCHYTIGNGCYLDSPDCMEAIFKHLCQLCHLPATRTSSHGLRWDSDFGKLCPLISEALHCKWYACVWTCVHSGRGHIVMMLEWTNSLSWGI